MNRVLILGGNGYIGSILAANLMASGYHVTIVGRSDPAEASCHKYIRLDLSARNAYKSICLDQVDIVLDLISYILPNSQGISNSEIRKVLKPYENLLTKISGKNYFFFSSGGTVYGNSSYRLDESAPLKPKSAYGIQKSIQEDLIQKIVPNGVILRVTNPYGSNQRVKNGVGLISYLLDCYVSERPLKLTVPKATTRDYIHISDLLNIVVRLISHKSRAFDVFNISTGEGSSLESLLNSVYDISRLKVDVDLSQFDESTHIFTNVLDNKKIKKHLAVDIENKVLDYIRESTENNQVAFNSKHRDCNRIV